MLKDKSALMITFPIDIAQLVLALIQRLAWGVS